MAKHRKHEPKRVSMLATTGGVFATVLLAAGLFGGQLIHNAPENKPEQAIPVQEQPARTEGSIDNVAQRQLPTTTQPRTTSQSAQNNSRGAGPTQPPTVIPRATQPPGTGASVPPVVVPVPPVSVDVEAPGLLSADVDLQKGLDVDLDARVGSLLSAEVEVKPTELPKIKVEVPPVTKLLGD